MAKLAKHDYLCDPRAWGASSGWRGDHAQLLGQSLVDNEETMSVTSTLLVNRFFGSHHSKLPVIHLSYVRAQNLLCLFFWKFYGQGIRSFGRSRSLTVAPANWPNSRILFSNRL